MPSEHSDIIKHFCYKYQERFGTKYLFAGGKDAKLISEMLKCSGFNQLKLAIDLFLTDEDDWLQNAGWTVGTLKSRLNRYLQQISKQDVKKPLTYL